MRPGRAKGRRALLHRHQRPHTAARVVPLFARAAGRHQRPPRRHGDGIPRKLHRVVREDAHDDALVLRDRPAHDQRQRDRADARRHDRPYHDRHGQGFGLHLRGVAAVLPQGSRRQRHDLQDPHPRGVHRMEPGQDDPQPRHQGRPARSDVAIHQPPGTGQRDVYRAQRQTGAHVSRPRPAGDVLVLVQEHEGVQRIRRGADSLVAGDGLRRHDDAARPAGALRQPAPQRRDVHDLARPDARPQGHRRAEDPGL